MQRNDCFPETGSFFSAAASAVWLIPMPADAHPLSSALNTLRNAFYSTPEFGVIISYCLLAFALGAIHALSPGHGKTIIAAYIVGARGRIKDAVTLGVAATASHTSGVILIGIILLYVFNQTVPPKITPYLSMLSGIMIICIGLYLIIFREKRHSHHHPHSHWAGSKQVFHTHSQNPHDHHQTGGHGNEHKHHPPPPISIWNNIVMGISGGIIPCPTALVILFLAISLNKVGLGLALIIFFSLGLAATLTVVGILFAKGSVIFEKQFSESPYLQKLPYFSSFVVVLLGGIMLTKSIMDLW